MKKILFLLIVMLPSVTMGQPAELMELWKSIDGLQYVYLQNSVDNAFYASSKLTPVKKEVESFGLPFGVTYGAAVREMVKAGNVREYMLNGNVAYKMHGTLFNDECGVFIGGAQDIVYEYYFLFDKKYNDIEILKTDFVKYEHALTNFFGEPSLKGRDACNKYLPISAIKNDAGVQFGNIYQTPDGMVYLSATKYCGISGDGQGLKMFVYFMHDKSLERAVNK